MSLWIIARGNKGIGDIMIRMDQLKINKDAVVAAKASGADGLKQLLLTKAAKLLHISEKAVSSLTIRRESIDARKKPEIFYIYSIELETEKEAQIFSGKQIAGKGSKVQITLAEPVEFRFPESGAKVLEHPIVIVGMGPAGLFCGYFLAKQGYRPILLERGKCVEERQADVERYWESGVLDTASNVQFGEGGAGAFSDGKLNTLVKDRDGRNKAVLQAFVDCGAKEEILYEAKPHVGTDVLCHVVKNMREEIIRCGGEVRFQSQVTDIDVEDWPMQGGAGQDGSEQGNAAEQTLQGGAGQDGAERGNAAEQMLQGGAGHDGSEQGNAAERPIHGEIVQGRRVRGVTINGRDYLPCEQLVLAAGHSARDTFWMLYEKKIPMEAKSFAVGLRVEHPQYLINESQYGMEDAQGLGAAPYKVTAQADNGRGVYSFCMCPGGYVVNASSEEKRLAVNGMSYSGRNGKNANSAVIVSVTPKDYGADHPLAGVEFQRGLEEKAYALAEGKIPMQRYGVFRACVEQGKTQDELGRRVEVDTGLFLEDNSDCSISPEHKGESAWADVSRILPKTCNEAFVQGMQSFGRQIKGFDRPDVILSGVESRTSSPLRIPRDETLQSQVRGLYPCGEGAGYAGGITSAAMDGLRVAEQIISNYAKPQDSERLL